MCWGGRPYRGASRLGRSRVWLGCLIMSQCADGVQVSSLEDLPDPADRVECLLWGDWQHRMGHLLLVPQHMR